MTLAALPPSFVVRSFALCKTGAVVEWPERADSSEWLSPYVEGTEKLTFWFSPWDNQVTWGAEGGEPGWAGPHARRFLNELFGTEGLAFRDHDHWLDPQRVVNAIDYVESRGGCHPANRLTWDQMIVPRARAAAAQQPAR